MSIPSSSSPRLDMPGANEMGDGGKPIEEGKIDEGDEKEEEEEEEEEECGFCLFMKSGPCRESFVAWERCVEKVDRDNQDVVSICFQVSSVLKECIEGNAEYYEPVLRAEREMELKETESISSDNSNKEEGSIHSVETLQQPAP